MEDFFFFLNLDDFLKMWAGDREGRQRGREERRGEQSREEKEKEKERREIQERKMREGGIVEQKNNIRTKR